jgi:hypothetical protein
MVLLEYFYVSSLRPEEKGLAQYDDTQTRGQRRTTVSTRVTRATRNVASETSYDISQLVSV